MANSRFLQAAAVSTLIWLGYAGGHFFQTELEPKLPPKHAAVGVQHGKPTTSSIPFPETTPAHQIKPELLYREGPAGPLEHEIEKAVRKLDPWVSDSIESDYSSQAKSVKARLCLESSAVRKSEAEAGLIKNLASYRPDQDILQIPEGEESKGGVESLAHELWHAFFDKVGKRGLMFQPSYEGPTSKQIDEFVAGFTKKPGFQDIAKAMERETRDMGSVALMEKSESIAKIIGQRPILLANEMETYIKSHLESIKLMKDSEKSRARSAIVTIFSAKDAYVRWIKTARSVIGQPILSMPLDAASLNASENTKKLFSETEKAFDAYKNGVKAAGIVYNMFDRVEFRKFQERFANAAAKDKDDKNSSRDKTELRETSLAIAQRELITYQSDKRIRDLRFATSYNTTRFGLAGMAAYKADLIYSTNKKKVQDLVGTTDEVMARIVQSLYGVYMGSFEPNSYPLTEEELRFLEQFKWKGKRVFGNGIDRYRIGLAMQSDGIPAEKIMHDLSGAQSYSYKGMEFKAVPVHFEIKGRLPMHIE